MSPPIYLRPEAWLDAKEASTWYEERNPGLRFDFLGELGPVLERVEENPLQFPEIGGSTHWALFRRFPYGI